MKLFKNREFAAAVAVYTTISAVAVITSAIINIVSGFITAAACVSLMVLFLVFTRKRYKCLEELADDIDKMLHNDRDIHLDKYSEGDLSILYSELYKLTVALREQSERLRSDKVYLADSIADISHQIKTPLTSINLIILLLTKQDITDERRTELIRELYTLANRIDRLVSTMLKLSKVDAGTVKLKDEMLPNSELLKRACESLMIPLELHGVRLDISAYGNFRGDVLWTCEAIENIVKNCMEHTPEGGYIRLEAAETPLYTELIISDSGSGIDHDDLPHIFERFYRGKTADSGSVGIGLALAKTVIVKQNGTIKVENNDVGGARFEIKLYKSII